MEINLTFKCIEITVEGNYQAETPMTRDYPGDPEYYEIYKVIICGHDLTEHLSNKFVTELEEYINENLDKYI